jgi:recombination protein RecR
MVLPPYPRFKKAVRQLRKLPPLSEQGAVRSAVFVAFSGPKGARTMAKSLIELGDHMGTCPRCHNISEVGQLCWICQEERPPVLCVVEEVFDLLSIEEAVPRQFRYHVLGGAISPMERIHPDQLTADEIPPRIKEEGIREVLIATGATTEGEATAQYLFGLLKDLTPIRRLGKGLPIGSKVQQMDGLTLRYALQVE